VRGCVLQQRRVSSRAPDHEWLQAAEATWLAVADSRMLGQILGTGGMATVWRATDQVLGREVAVKVLSPQYAVDAGFMARFEREARHAAQLSHPRLVTVFDCGIDNDTAFIVMELVAGRTLRQVLDDAEILPPGQAVSIAAAVCEALEVAHAAALVHRDIKPANIVVSGRDLKVLDFEIARADGPADGTPTLGARRWGAGHRGLPVAGTGIRRPGWPAV
jgi:eukaryotic-like serine/threonine-protein kinase